MTELMNILESLRYMGVDTSIEILLLEQQGKAREKPVLLLVGDEPGRPLDLLKGLGVEPLCPEGKFLPYPVQCVYGETLTLTVTDSLGEHHHFYDIPSFQAHAGWDVTLLTVTAAAPVLQRADIRILTVTEGMLRNLGILAGDCAGAILALDCSAGAPEPAASELCRWLRDAAGLGQRVCLLLNHTETGAVNWSLESMLDVEPVETLPCDHTAAPGGEKHPAGALAAAAEALLSGAAGGKAPDTEMRCAAAAMKKLLDKRSQLEDEAAQLRRSADWFYDSAKVFRARMEIACTAMTIQLNEQQKALLNANINGLKEHLKAELPGMARELAKKNGAQAKTDLRNLGGSYVEALCNSYMEFATRFVADKLFRPQAQAVFQEASESYKTLVQQAPIPVEEWTSKRDKEILKPIQIGYIDPKGPLAELLSGFFVVAFKQALKEYLGPFGYTVGKVVEQVLEELVILALPASVFVSRFSNRMASKLDEVMPSMYKTLEETVLPQVSSDIRDGFQDMIDRCSAILEEQGDGLTDQANDLDQHVKALNDCGEQLKKFLI